MITIPFLAFQVDDGIATPFQSEMFPVAASVGSAVYLGLLGLVFVCALWGFLWGLNQKDDVPGAKRAMVQSALVIALCASFPFLFFFITQTMDEFSKEYRDRISDAYATWAKTEAERPGNPLNIPQNIAFAIFDILKPINSLVSKFMEVLREAICLMLLPLCPIPLACLFLPVVRQAGITFIMMCLGLTLWKVGFLLADLFMISIGPWIMGLVTGTATASGGIAAAVAAGATFTWPVITLTLLGAACAGIIAIIVFQIVLYVATALGIAAILQGGNFAMASLTGAAGGAAIAMKAAPAVGMGAAVGAPMAAKGIAAGAGAVGGLATAGGQLAHSAGVAAAHGMANAGSAGMKAAKAGIAAVAMATSPLSSSSPSGGGSPSSASGGGGTSGSGSSGSTSSAGAAPANPHMQEVARVSGMLRAKNMAQLQSNMIQKAKKK